MSPKPVFSKRACSTRVWQLTLLAVSLLLNASCGDSKAERRYREAPRDEQASVIREVLHDFGVVSPGTTHSHEFQIHNNSRSELEIAHLVAGCSCTVATPSSLIIPVNGTVGVTVSFNASTQSMNASKTVTIFYKNISSTTLLRIRAKVRAPLEVSPRFLDFRYSGEKVPTEHRFEVYNYDSSDWTGISLLNVPPWIVAKQEQLPETREPNGCRQRWLVTMGLLPDQITRMPFGMSEGQLQISSADEPEKRIASIQVKLNHHRPVEARPERLFFGEVNTNEISRKEFLLIDHRDGVSERDSTPTLRPPLDERLSASFRSIAPGVHRVTVTLTVPNAGEYFTSAISIGFVNSPDLEVPVQCVARIR